MLGEPVGSSNTVVEEMAVEIVGKYLNLFQRIQHVDMPEVTADQILRQCGVPSINYLTRVVAPQRIRKAAEIFDGWVLKAYVKKHEIPVSLLGAGKSTTVVANQ